MSSSPTVPPEMPAPAGPAAARPWSAWAEARRDWRSFLGLLGGLAVAGVPLGVLWWALAPRADYRITSAGPVAIGNPSEELLVGDDVVFVLIVAVLGLVVGIATWLIRSRRGLAVLLGAALGTLAAAAVAWQVGELLGPAPTRAALAHVGGRVTTSLTLGMWPALAVGPFVALLVWLVGALYARTDGLGRTVPEPASESALVAEPVSEPGDGLPAGSRRELASGG